MAYIQLQSTWDTVCISCKDQKDTPSWFFRLNWVHTTKPSEFRTVPNNTGFDPLPGQLPLLSRRGSNIRLSWKHYRLMNCFGTSPTAQTFSTPDRPNMNQRFCEMQALSHGGRQRHKLNWANSRCFTFVETGAEILQTQSQLWSCSLLGTGKDYLVPNMLLGKAGEWRFKQKHQTRWGDAMCPLANKAKSISRFTWKIHTGACSFAICGSESSCWESPSLLQGSVGFGGQSPTQKPKHHPYPFMSICRTSGS